MQCENKPSHFGRENYLNASLFVLLFVFLLLFLVLILFFVFFFGGGQGVGVGFGGVFFGGGLKYNATRRYRNPSHFGVLLLAEKILIAGGLFVLFCFVFCFLFVFLVLILFLLFFRGRGLVELFWGWWTGYRLSQLCSEHCITENFSAISFSVCFAFCCGLVCLVCFFKPLQYFGAPEN